MAEIGKISGPLLEDNLQRSGVDLAFDTDLLYLDVANRRIGVGNIAPIANFTAVNPLSTNLQVDTQLTVGDMNLYTNTVQYPIGNLVLSSGNVVYAPNWKTTGGLNVGNNTISATVGDQDININPTGTGRVTVNSDMLVNGNLRATGDITFDGNLIFGDNDTDSVNIKADLASDIRPDVTDTYSLGINGKRWLNTYTKNLYADTITSNSSYKVNNIEVTLRQGKTWYVSKNGLDTNVGNHQNGPFLTIVKALSVATSGDTINVYPGTYTEICPMIVPVGVTIKGLDIRTVIISPTVATRNKDIFLVNGETTIEDLTVTGFEYDNVNNTGYAFKFANNFTVTSRSPYIKNVSVITQGSTVRLGTAPSDDPRGFLAGDAGRGAYIDGALATSSSKEASMLFHSCTFITPGVECIVMTNGVRVEWLNCFTYFASIGLKATNGTQGFNPTNYVYDSVTGKYLPSNAIRFSLTADAPGATVNPTGANSFKFRTGTGVVTSGVFGSSVASAYDMNTLITSQTAFAIYNRNTSTLVALFTVWDTFVDNNSVVFWSDAATGPEQGQIIYPAGINYTTFRSLFTTGTIYDWVFVPNVSTFTGYKTAAELGIKFGAEIRSINSASIYGNFGATADGDKTLMYLVGHNFAYVGAGRFSNNDPTLAIENNEALMSNGGVIYYQSTDQSGNVRVGPVFKINGETGAVNFVSNGLTLGGSSSITFSSGGHQTYLDPREVQQDNLTFTGATNTIQSTIGNIIFSPQSGVINLNTNTFTIPKGNDTTLILSNPGEIRYNIDNNHFEGYAANGLLNLYALEDSTRTTRITPELTPGADDKTIRMYSDNDLKVSMNTTAVTFKNLHIGNLRFDQPQLNITANQTLTLLPTGTGLVKVKNFTIQDDLITNTTNNANINLNSASGSYVRFPGTGAMVTPVGDTSQRPNIPEIGMQRYNTDLGFLEVWSGSAWVNASGSTSVTPEDMVDIADFWALVIG